MQMPFNTNAFISIPLDIWQGSFQRSGRQAFWHPHKTAAAISLPRQPTINHRKVPPLTPFLALSLLINLHGALSQT